MDAIRTGDATFPARRQQHIQHLPPQSVNLITSS